jgi:signal transduction histidine kinase
MRKKTYWILILAVIAIGLLHLFTPGRFIFLHDTYRRLSYLPIALGGIWYGVWGGLSLAAMTSIAFIPHILMFMGHGPQAYLSELTEVLLYLLAGGLVGLIAGKEANLRESYRSLSERLQESYKRLQSQTRLLIQTEEQLLASQRLSALGELSASIAHEIKNPLSCIKGSGEILLDEFPPGHPKREFAEIVLAEVDRLATAVDKILKFTPVKREEGDPKFMMPVDAVTKRIQILMQNHLEKKGIDFTITGSKEIGNQMVHGEKLAQVLLNLLLNAVDAVQSGGKIWMTMIKDSQWISIEIHDNGPGLPAVNRDQIFAPFYSSKPDGTGLGLPISRRIMEGLGGEIHTCDHADGGACFTLRIPTNAIDLPAGPHETSP